MSSSVLRIFALMLAIGAIAIGYFGYKASKQPLKPQPVQVEAMQPKGESVVLATRDIPAGQIIIEDDLAIALVPIRPVRSFASGTHIIGRKSRIDISSGEMVLSSHFPSYSQLALSLNPGERAVAVKVDEAVGVGGFIEPGDHVDVLLYLQANQEVGKNSSAQVILPKVRVLAFGNMLESPDTLTSEGDYQPNLLDKAKTGGTKGVSVKREKEEPTRKKSKTAVLAIAENDTAILMLAESSGKLRLALHGVEHEESTPAVAEANLMQKAHAPYDGSNNTKANNYIILRELTRNEVVKHTIEAPTTDNRKSPRIIIHKGHSIETIALDR